MAGRRIYDEQGDAFFVTFSCYHRRRLLDHPAVRDEFLRTLTAALARHDCKCAGYVVMPDHVHLIVGFTEANRLSRFLQGLKRSSSQRLKRLLQGVAPEYAKKLPANDPFRQSKYYVFNLYSQEKLQQKLEYLHANPVRMRRAKRSTDWRWSSARHYLLGEESVVPIVWDA